MEEIRTIYYEMGKLYLLDQNAIPERVEYLCCRTYAEVAESIRRMTVRGAPAIGVAAAYGVVLAALRAMDRGQVLGAAVEAAITELKTTRPTAVNLFWALDRMRNRFESEQKSNPQAIVAALTREAQSITDMEAEANRRMGDWGATLVPEQARVITHCNAGALATVGWGTALGVIRAAHTQGKIRMVYADETRPRLQGMRLTAWELVSSGIPVTVLCDNMAAYLMSREHIDLVVVGADRIAANGDVANKIGTYGLAIAANHHGVPFYVAAPTSTIDFSLTDGSYIPIEERPEDEVRCWGDRAAAPLGAAVLNPAFDVTPARLISAIITEKGIVRPPMAESLRALRG